jgi:cathepsin L
VDETPHKSYSQEDFLARYTIFKANLDFINAHNADPTNTFSVKMNKFGDLSNAEFVAIFNGFKMPAVRPSAPQFVPLKGQALPDSKDWRDAGAVTAVKNQEQCGSCWSFSTTGSVEGCHKISAGTLVSLSEKNLMDCSWSQGNQGCNGGLMTSAMDYIISNKGIDTEASYPYVAVSSHTCKYNAANKGSTLASYTNVKEGSESDLQNAVNTAPTSVAIDASHNSFQFYSSGVYYEKSCSPTQLDHGVLAVGWGTSSGSDYWIVKNSWGTDWGQDGYIWMSRNKKNNCGIATMATLPATCN